MNKILSGIIALSMLAISCKGVTEEVKLLPIAAQNSVDAAWKEFHCASGKCSMHFPNSPEHVSEQMKVPEEGYDLRYDAYISTLGKQSVFMLLIAEYPTLSMNRMHK